MQPLRVDALESKKVREKRVGAFVTPVDDMRESLSRRITISRSSAGEGSPARPAALQIREPTDCCVRQFIPSLAQVLVVFPVEVDHFPWSRVEHRLYTRAGLEICVVATKTVLAQIVALELLALRLAQLRGTLSSPEIAEHLRGLHEVPTLVEKVLGADADVAAVVKQIAMTHDFFFLGRHVGFPTALEGALKLKEITYVHAEGYPAGELKHGPLALIEPGVVVVVMVTDDDLKEKLLGNLAEVKSRGATVVAVAHHDDEEVAAVADYVLGVPRAAALQAPLVDMVALQQFAYHLARARGLNVDRPRNLAKTVTVE